MGTVEILIVFSALMALISLVTIGIDWLGKPLKNRRFIPRMYRFDDEKLPVDEYGNTTLEGAEPQPMGPPFFAPMPVQVQSPPPMPYPVAAPMHPPTAAPLARVAQANESARPPIVPTSTDANSPLEPAAERSQPAPRQVAQLAPEIAAKRSAFSDTIASHSGRHEALPAELTGDDKLWASPSPFTSQQVVDVNEAAPKSWKPGLPLDTTINDNKPNLSVKAERFWKTIGATIGDSHFDDDDLSRMHSGKSPRRRDPRTGRDETMVLTGLREASVVDEVRMRWPDESVDPWSAQ